MKQKQNEDKMLYYHDLLSKYETQETQERIRPAARQLTRKRINAKVSVRFRDEIAEGMTDNLSLKGTYIRTDVSVAIGEHILIELFLPNETSPSVSVTGQVVRRDENGIGLQFKDLGHNTAMKLHDFVAMLERG